jgi:hypothetical protein
VWTVIYIARSQKKAEQIVSRLNEEGFLAKIRQSSVSKQYEILVPESELKEVEEALGTILPETI